MDLTLRSRHLSTGAGGTWGEPDSSHHMAPQCQLEQNLGTGAVDSLVVRHMHFKSRQRTAVHVQMHARTLRSLFRAQVNWH